MFNKHSRYRRPMKDKNRPRMNHKIMLSGTLAGLLLCFAFFSGLTATGFSVALGEQTINFRQTLTEDTLIPLTLASNITSFTITGTYQGSGQATIHLVGPSHTWHVASYNAPQVHLNSTFVLEQGGTVVQLAEGQKLNYTHVFEDACDDTCEGIFEGPFFLQARVREGTFTLTSASYSTPQFVTRPQAPTDEQLVIDIPEPERPQRQNPALECSLTCAEDMMCRHGYCISHTGHLNITDSSGRLVALFDKHGRLLLAGDVYEFSEEQPTGNAFRIQNRNGDIAWITDSGDLHLRGELIEQVNTVPLSGSENFVIRNPQEIVLVIQGSTGDLFTQNTIVTSILP